MAALGAGALALLLGFVGARALERRLASVSDVARLVTAGDLSHRLPQSGRGDEFDRLVVTVNGMLERIEALMAAQRQVTDDIAHDLRGPLQRLRQMLEGALPDGRRAGAGAGDRRAGHRAGDLRRPAADRAGGGRGREPAGRRPVGAGDGGGGRLRARGGGGRAAFATDVAPGLRLRGDPALLQRMLANLLDNALTHGAGAISVALRPGPVLVVADEGPGRAGGGARGGAAPLRPAGPQPRHGRHRARAGPGQGRRPGPSRARCDWRGAAGRRRAGGPIDLSAASTLTVFVMVHRAILHRRSCK